MLKFLITKLSAPIIAIREKRKAKRISEYWHHVAIEATLAIDALNESGLVEDYDDSDPLNLPPPTVLIKNNLCAIAQYADSLANGEQVIQTLVGIKGTREIPISNQEAHSTIQASLQRVESLFNQLDQLELPQEVLLQLPDPPT